MSADYIFVSSIDNDLRNAYASMLHGEPHVAADVIQTVLLNIRSMTFNDARMPSALDVQQSLLTAWCHIKRREFHVAHNIIRDLHYRFRCP